MEERELLEALIGAARAGGGLYLGQLEDVEVVSGCRRSCPSVDLSVGGSGRRGRPTRLVMADAE